MRNVMARAWEIARKAVAKFGGKVKQYFAMALAQAWKESKLSLSYIASRFSQVASNFRYEYTKTSAWEKHGFKRVYFYINGYKGYVGFSNDLSSITASYVDGSYAHNEVAEVKALVEQFNRGELSF